MASPAPVKAASLQPLDWILAASSRLSAEGIDSVRVEVLARDLAVSKGSFYWHFHDREDLLAKMLARWEAEEVEWLEAASSAKHGAAARWARFVERTAQTDRARLQAALHSWARRDADVASKIAALEVRKARFIADVLRDVGLAPVAAETWAEIVQLASIGWLDRATRDSQFPKDSRGLNDFLSQLILAASAQSPSVHR